MEGSDTAMQIVIALFDRFTALDAVGPHQVLHHLPGAGASAGIDMALALAGRVAGDEVAERIQLGIEYDPRPPYQSGSPATARAGLVDWFTAASRFAQAAG